MVLENALLNTTTRVEMSGTVHGTATEKAIIHYLIRRVGVQDCHRIQKTSCQILAFNQFTSKRKRCSIALKRGDTVRIYCKGAPEIILEHAKSFLDVDGCVKDLDVQGMQNTIDALA